MTDIPKPTDADRERDLAYWYGYCCAKEGEDSVPAVAIRRALAAEAALAGDDAGESKAALEKVFVCRHCRGQIDRILATHAPAAGQSREPGDYVSVPFEPVGKVAVGPLSPPGTSIYTNDSALLALRDLWDWQGAETQELPPDRLCARIRAILRAADIEPCPGERRHGWRDRPPRGHQMHDPP